MFELGIVGAKNSGKTTLIEKLLPRLKKNGLKVASIKHTVHNHSFDVPGKDSFRHRQAGAELTIAVSSTSIALHCSNDQAILKVLRHHLDDQFDLCLIEGDKRSGNVKILLTREFDEIKLGEIKNVIATYGPAIAIFDSPSFELDEVNSLADFVMKLVEQKKTHGSKSVK